MKRLLLVLAALVVMVLIAGAVLLSTRFDSQELGRKVLETAGEHLGLELTADRFRLRLLSGLELEGLTVRGRLPAGDLDGRIAHLTLRHELWPLLTGRLVIHELRLDQPDLELTATPETEPASPPSADAAAPSPVPSGDAPSGATAEPPGGGGLDLQIDRVRIEGGRLVLRSADPEEPATEVEGLDLALDDVTTRPAGGDEAARGLDTGGLDTGGLNAVRATGTLGVTEARLGDLDVTEARGEVSLGDGHLRLTDGRLTLPAGEVKTLDLDLDLTTEPYGYRVTLGADPLRTGELLAAAPDEGETSEEGEPAQQGGGFGPSRLDFQAQGRGGGIDGMEGGGTLAVQGGTLPPLPILVAVDSLVDGAALVGAEYQPFDVAVQVGSGRMEILPFQLAAGDLTLDVRGTAVPEGAWNLWLALGLPRAGVNVKEVPRELLDALTDGEGRLHLPLRVSGTAESVRVVPDPDALSEATRREARERIQGRVRKELDKGLEKLFGSGKGGG